MLQYIIKAFSVDVILVMNHDKLYSSLLPLVSEGITVVKLPISGGIFRRVSHILICSSPGHVLIGDPLGRHSQKEESQEPRQGVFLRQAPAKRDLLVGPSQDGAEAVWLQDTASWRLSALRGHAILERQRPRRIYCQIYRACDYRPQQRLAEYCCGSSQPLRGLHWQ